MTHIHVKALAGLLALGLAAGAQATLSGADDPVVQKDDKDKKDKEEKKADTVVLYILDAKGSG